MKRTTCRTVLNRLLDGREIKLADPQGSATEWTLTYEELTDDEITAIRDFFLSMEGSLGHFVFLDPTDNLLAWSEKFDEAAWEKDPLLRLTAGCDDPFGATGGFHITNSAGAPQRLKQILNLPGTYNYAFSIWARGGQDENLTIIRGGETCAFAVGPDWRRISFSGALNSDDDTVGFGVELPASSSVDLFGAQVEAQLGASLYKKTVATGGIYPTTRFGDEALALTTAGPGRHGCVVHLRAR